MISESLYQRVLIDPVKKGADELFIVSGYATSAMAFHHMEEIQKSECKIRIHLLVGMCSTDGLSLSNHRGFQKIMGESHPQWFQCSYIYDTPPVHSKLYIWRRGGSSFESFIGSANYTQTAFSNRQGEIMAPICDIEVLGYFEELEKRSVYCNHNEIDTMVRIYNDQYYYKRHVHEEHVFDVDEKSDNSRDESVTVSLLSRTGEVQRAGGLNWGQRESRNRNEAYLQLSPDVYKSDFFPEKGVHFTVVTDDSKTFICTRAQKNEYGAAIETPHNNALLGEYFRNRLGMANGAFITRSDLEDYGRTDVKFYKFDDENYYMDFSQ